MILSWDFLVEIKSYGGTFDGTTAVKSGTDWVDYSYITDTKAINVDLSAVSKSSITNRNTC